MQAMKEHKEQGENSRYVLTSSDYNGKPWPVLVEVVLGQYIHDLEKPGVVVASRDTGTSESGVDREESTKEDQYESDKTGTLMF